MNTNQAGKSNVRLYVISALIVASIAAVAATVWAVRRGGPDLAAEAAVFVVKPGPLTISVIESGTIQNREKIVVKCRVEGRSTIIWMIEEGQHVQKGDKLIELDSSQFVDKRDQQEITVTNAEASFTRAKENFAVAQNQAKSDIEKAQLALDFAWLDLEKYLGKGELEAEYIQQAQEAQKALLLARAKLERAKKLKGENAQQIREAKNAVAVAEEELTRAEELKEKHAQQVQEAEKAIRVAKDEVKRAEEKQDKGEIDRAKSALWIAEGKLKGEYAQQVQEAENAITVAKEEWTRAEKKFEGSKRLLDKEFISKTEYDADRLALTRRKLDYELAQSKMELLSTYTHVRMLAQLRSDVSQARMAMERTRRKARADVLQARVDMQAKGSQHERQQTQLKKIKQQIANCVITSPVAGQAVYATTGGGRHRRSQEPLSEGQDIRERQELFHIPTADGMMARIKIHESSLQKVQAGMAARVTVSAVPGKAFAGRVAKIAPLPDAQSFWMNPDLKVFNTEVHLDGENGDLRPGMSCSAEIIVEEHARATFVPIQTVQQVNGTATVFVRTDDGVAQRAVKLGLDNNRVVHVLEGLAEGEKVLLAPPLIAPSVEQQQQASAAGMGKATPRAAQKPRPTTSQPTSQAQSQPAGRRKAAPAIDFRRMRNMTPEQQRKMWEKLTPEQRKAIQERLRSRRRGRGERGRRQGRGERGRRERRPEGQERP